MLTSVEFHDGGKQAIISDFKQSDSDVGSCEVQVALLTTRIKYLTEHMKSNKKDQHTRYGLERLVSKRRKLLSYLKRKQLTRYQSLIKRLSLRDSY